MVDRNRTRRAPFSAVVTFAISPFSPAAPQPLDLALGCHGVYSFVVLAIAWAPATPAPSISISSSS